MGVILNVGLIKFQPKKKAPNYLLKRGERINMELT